MTLFQPFRCCLFLLASVVGLAAQEPPVVEVVLEMPEIDPATQDVIDGALAWLTSQQQPNGSWGKGAPGRDQYYGAMTAYTLIAYMAAGNLPGEGPHGKTVEKGVDYLLSIVLPDGQIRTNNQRHYMYSHGIVTLVLAELYGQTQNPEIRPALERMVKVIMQAQDRSGGWRYQPRPSGADISVTVVQAVAIRAARNVGVDVPQDVFDKAVEYIRACKVADSAGFAYQAGQDRPGFARTAAAIYSLQVLGNYDDPLIPPGSQYLFDKKEASWAAYGNYYAAPAQYMIGGDTWVRWYEAAHKKFMGSVNRDGKYCYWGKLGAGVGRADSGPVYMTSVYTTVLAMPYNYLPLYQR
ncbi:prenyltransferase/squalene oxidase repeat-containing protein [Cerasicoccus arenae]|uniref:Prenyltransferase n=1 Tax=Cerasicoccus arenae TaxID=424488 RepID=A0A8J3GEU9_9BACT|nr:prenyltransferase/squalene oxidase repeat-containing protein [Cerasicoccus arenae]MBK1859879.1 terpene cyclase/mutase family protein [Cerasicoccus arenae]GHC01422.1 hypothetical protein GCM10007047_17360 [Cerasicoccus arenae]